MAPEQSAADGAKIAALREQLGRENEMLAEAGGGSLDAMTTQVGDGDGEGGDGGD